MTNHHTAKLAPSHASSTSRSPESSATAVPSRRAFLQSGSVGIAATALMSGVHVSAAESKVSGSPSNTVRLAVIGAGGRGKGAVIDSLTINPNAKLVAIADINQETPGKVRAAMAKRFGDRIDVKDDAMYSGLDAYRRVLDRDDVDVVLFATPPGFRPQYVMEAVQAGKHVFAEKPTCVDPAGYHTCLKADELANRNGTSIVTGTQYRRQTSFIEVIDRIHSGAIGEIISATTRYCSQGIWFKNRPEGMSDTEYQIFNWMHFIWLSGDQIVEQAVHNIDAVNWLMGGPPETAYGSGGRFTRPEGSEMWDNMAIDYTYPGNKVVSFMCRQIPGSTSANHTFVYGTKGIARVGSYSTGASLMTPDGEETWSIKGSISDAYKQEHKDLVDSVVQGKPIVEFKQTAESSLTAVMGRLAAYTGKLVDWDFVSQKSTLDLFPETIDFNGARPESKYAIPGREKLV
ncbi:MAG: Gfo/Idh/MocA family oxidoreductase [Planctomycetota bacterium]